jgi:hypothetical protein
LRLPPKVVVARIHQDHATTRKRLPDDYLGSLSLRIACRSEGRLFFVAPVCLQTQPVVERCASSLSQKEYMTFCLDKDAFNMIFF